MVGPPRRGPCRQGTGSGRMWEQRTEQKGEGWASDCARWLRLPSTCHSQGLLNQGLQQVYRTVGLALVAIPSRGGGAGLEGQKTQEPLDHPQTHPSLTRTALDSSQGERARVFPGAPQSPTLKTRPRNLQGRAQPSPASGLHPPANPPELAAFPGEVLSLLWSPGQRVAGNQPDVPTTWGGGAT